MGETPTNWQPSCSRSTRCGWVLGPAGCPAYSPAPQAPTIAIVDSGIDATRRRLRHPRRCAQDSSGDGDSTGTTATAPWSRASRRALERVPGRRAQREHRLARRRRTTTARRTKSDVLAAADWIHENEQVRHPGRELLARRRLPAQLHVRPARPAVEKLWLTGVVVVAAAGTTPRTDRRAGPYAPANDPFVITVGAADINDTAQHGDDFNAPWSAYGYTPDGFLKPELGAPGRYMNARCRPAATMRRSIPTASSRPATCGCRARRSPPPSSPGCGADLLALHPDWTPDQVKGALMLTARAGRPRTGVGEAMRSACGRGRQPAEPATVTDPRQVTRTSTRDRQNGGTDFEPRAADELDATSPLDERPWTNASWSSASWSRASWTQRLLEQRSWSSASWSSAASGAARLVTRSGDSCDGGGSPSR